MCGGILLMYKMPAARHTQAQSTALGIPGMLPSGLTHTGCQHRHAGHLAPQAGQAGKGDCVACA